MRHSVTDLTYIEQIQYNSLTIEAHVGINKSPEKAMYLGICHKMKHGH